MPDVDHNAVEESNMNGVEPGDTVGTETPGENTKNGDNELLGDEEILGEGLDPGDMVGTEPDRTVYRNTRTTVTRTTRK